MAEEKEKARYQVVVISTPDIEKTAQIVANKTKRPLEQCMRIVKSAPAVVATGMDGLYADDMVGMIKAMGGEAEKRVELSSVHCPIHKDQTGRAYCQVCNKVICTICIKAADGSPICPDCSGESSKIETKFPWVRLVIMLSIIGGGVYGYLTLTREREPWKWDRTFKLAVIGVFEEFQNAESWGYVAGLMADSDQEYIDLRDHTITDMAGWFQKEYARYGGTLDQALDVTVFRLIKAMEKPPDPPPVDMKFIDRFLDYKKFTGYFRDLAAENEVDLSGFDGVIWIHFIEGATFNGFTESWSARNDNLSVVRCYIDPDGVDTNIMIVLHEFAHLVEAEDHYNPSNDSPLNPEGLVEPFGDDIYPQDYGELMAGRISGGENDSDVVHALRDLRIGIYTAYEMDWVDEEEMQGYIDSQTVPELD